MNQRKRLSICYAAPGLNFVPSAGPTRNVLNLANALSQWADVTVAFRSIPRESLSNGKYKVIAIEPQIAASNPFKDDNATRGLDPFRHWSYCRTLWCFSQQQASVYDVVLEKGWRLSGYLLNGFRRRGVPGVLVENNVHRADTGAVTLIQRFGSAANLNIHLHCLVLDGLYRNCNGGAGL